MRVSVFDGVDSRYDGKEVLEFVEMVWSPGDSAVQRIEEVGVELSKRQLVNNMREIKCCDRSLAYNVNFGGEKTDCYGPSDLQRRIPDNHVHEQ